MERLERQILQLPLHGVDAETVGEWRVDLERLLRLLDLLLLPQIFDLAQVVQTVRELDQDHAHVLGHRHDQLAVVLGLRLLATLKLDARQLRDTFDELGDLRPELLADVVQLGVGVLDHDVEQRGRDRLVVEPQLCADLGRSPGVEDEILARATLLALVCVRGEEEGPRDQVAVDVGVVRGDVRDQLVDELLVFFLSLKDSHTSSVLRGSGPPSPLSVASLKGRKWRSDDEGVPSMTWYRRRQERRAAARAARVLVALD